MGRPGTSSAATRRPDLQAVQMDFNLIADRNGYIGNRVFPMFDAAQAGGTFRKVKVESLLKEAESGRRMADGGYARDNWKFEDDTFATLEYGFEELVDDNQKNKYKEVIDYEKVCSMRAQHRLLYNYEIRVATQCFDETAFTAASAFTDIANVWGTPGASTPIDDVNTAKREVRGQCGMWPNAIIYNYNNHMHLRESAQIRDRIASSGAGESTKARRVTTEQIAECFDLPYVFVAGGTKNTANEAVAASFADIWSNSYALVCVVAETGDLEEPCIGRTFHWDGDGSVFEGLIEEYYDPRVRGNVIRSRHQTQEKRIMILAGHLLKVD
jgi:hypothetical protein